MDFPITNLMREFVQAYIDGRITRREFDLHFLSEYLRYRLSMERENHRCANLFKEHFADMAIGISSAFSDAQHRKIVAKLLDNYDSAVCANP